MSDLTEFLDAVRTNMQEANAPKAGTPHWVQDHAQWELAVHHAPLLLKIIDLALERGRYLDDAYEEAVSE